jgi:hypothetical protein
MADEFTVSTLLRINKGFQQDTKSVTNLKVTQVGDGSAGGVQNVGTSAEAIDVGDVSTLGLAWFRNLDATNFVQVGQDVGGGGFEEFFKLLAGETALMRLDLAATGVLQAKADTAAIELQYIIYEE